MTREEQLEFCKICRNKAFDPRQGIACGLTNLPADFSVACDSYRENTGLKIKFDAEKKAHENLYYPASQGQRLANYLLDRVFLLIFSLIFGLILGIVLAVILPETFSVFDENNLLLTYPIDILAGLIYFSIFEYTSGKTPAKWITKTKVVDINGKKPNFGRILLRSLCRFIPFEAFSYITSNPECCGLHDKLSRTRVVEE